MTRMVSLSTSMNSCSRPREFTSRCFFRNANGPELTIVCELGNRMHRVGSPGAGPRRGAATQAKQLVEFGSRQPGVDQLDRRSIERCRRTDLAIPAAQDEAAAPGVEMECHPYIRPETQLRVSERVDVAAWSDG